VRRGLFVPLALLAVPLTLVAIAAVALSPTVRRGHYEWTKVPARPKLVRTEVAGAALGRDIYVIGGFVPPNKTTGAVERFDTVRPHWKRVRSLPVPLNHAGAVGFGGHVYVVGGYASKDGLGAPVKTLYRYDPKRDRWKRLADMPTARAAMAVGATRGRIYVAGGSDGVRQTATLAIYNVRKNAWSRGPSLSVAREHLGGAAADGEFYAVAGRNNQSGNLAITEVYSAARRRWKRLPDMPKARGGNGAGLYENGLVAIGGEEAGGTIAEVDLYDWVTRKWERVTAMPTPRHGLAVAVTGEPDTELWAIAGGPKPGFAFSNAVERFTYISAPD
jgi:non-specific serine/threonine protein kinase